MGITPLYGFDNLVQLSDFMSPEGQEKRTFRIEAIIQRPLDNSYDLVDVDDKYHILTIAEEYLVEVHGAIV